MKPHSLRGRCSMLALVGAATVFHAQAADFLPLDFSSHANFELQSHNALFPTGYFLTRYAVPFFIPDSAKNAWGSGNGIEGACFCDDGLYQMTLPVSLSGVKAIYTLAGANWGRDGSNMTITGVFDNGQRAVWTFKDGQQLRDWNLYPAFTTTINGTNANEVFRVSPPLPAWDNNPDVLDMQTLAIPTTLQGARLRELIVADLRHSIGGLHSGFVAGITTSTVGPVTPALQASVVPEPDSWMLMFFGLSCLWLIDSRRARNADLSCSERGA